ncbi:MAG: hemK [Ilumatobacteraceae bacterium]|jgi:release factor glutamine methyltransferase|nr:hemK [Ilumatobacteraceae bacterium]
MADRPDGTVSWRSLWTHTAVAVGGRPQARWLCETASGRDGDEFLAELESPASVRAVAHLDRMLARLAGGEPLQYVLGRWGFRRLDLMIDRRVLIPRPETEEVAGVAIDVARARPRPLLCADLGTGSGAIGLSLAAELPLERVTVWLTDVSGDALDVARANLAGIGRGAVNVRLGAGSWYDALPDELRGRLDVIVSNPPYVRFDDPSLEEVVRTWEPSIALLAGPDGGDALRTIIAGAPDWLAPGGSLVLEIGADQGPAVTAMLSAAGLVDVEIRRDAADRDRIALARRP